MKLVYVVKKYSEKGTRVWLTVAPPASYEGDAYTSIHRDTYTSVISLPKTFDFRPKRVILTDEEVGGESNV